MNSITFCRQAIAYLKPSLTEEEADDAVELSTEDAPVAMDLHNGLLVLYLVDEGNSFAYVQGRELASAGLTPSELHQHGLANLSRIARDRARVERHGSVYAVFLDGNFEASLLLVDELWDETLADSVPNGCTVAIPSRDVLAFCDSASAEGLVELRGIVDRVTPAGDHLISGRLYQRQAGRWIPLADA